MLVGVVGLPCRFVADAATRRKNLSHNRNPNQSAPGPDPRGRAPESHCAKLRRYGSSSRNKIPWMAGTVAEWWEAPRAMKAGFM
jgi:hypothetical protein